MSKLIYWLIAIGAYTIYFVIKSLKSNHSDVKGTPIGGEVFPEVKMYNNPELKTFEEYPESTKTKITHKTDIRKRVVLEKSSNSGADVPTSDDEKKDNATKISLKNRSEAKRAFIHAEIFNKKYS